MIDRWVEVGVAQNSGGGDWGVSYQPGALDNFDSATNTRASMPHPRQTLRDCFILNLIYGRCIRWQ